MNSEKKLKAITKAMGYQYPESSPLITGEFNITPWGCLQDKKKEDIQPVIAILIDTAGLKAAYHGYWCEDCGSRCHDNSCPFQEDYWDWTAREILDAWNSKEGNNWQKAIDCAYDLLPTE